MPFGPYDNFQDCLNQNQDKANPPAFCAYLHKQITGAYPSEMQANMPEDAWTIFLEKYTGHLTGDGKDKPALEAEREANGVGITALNEAGWIYSRIGWVHQFAAPKLRNVTGVRVFATGSWTDSAGNATDYKEADLDVMVQAFNAGVPSNVPLKAGHTADSFNQQIAEKLGVPVEVVTGDRGSGQIAIGRMVTLERRTNLLFGGFEGVPDPIADLIESRLYNTVSVEIEDDVNGYKAVITAVALLGAEEPAVDVATLDRALVFGGKRPNARVVTFSNNAGDLEREFATVKEKMAEVIKGMRGAPIFRALLSTLTNQFNQLIRKKGEHQASDIPEEVLPLLIGEYQGNIDALIRWAKGVGFDQCVVDLQGKVTDPVKVCGWLKGQALSKEAGMEYQISEEQLAALIAALGLSEGATFEDIMAAIAELKGGEGGEVAPGAMAAEFSKTKTELTKAKDRITLLEKSETEHGFLEQTRLFTAIPNRKPEEIAVELAEIQDKQGKEAADRMLSTYQELDKMGQAALSAVGTSRKGDTQVSFEQKVTDYMKDHPDVSSADANKAVMQANPGLYSQYAADVRGKNVS